MHSTMERRADPRFVLVLLGLVGLAFLSRSPESTAERPAPKAPVEQTGPSPMMVEVVAEDRVRDLLRNPSSARFRNKRVPYGRGYLCGEVNAENGFGGRTGYQRFIAGAHSEMPVALEESMDAVEFASAWNDLC